MLAVFGIGDHKLDWVSPLILLSFAITSHMGLTLKMGSCINFLFQLNTTLYHKLSQKYIINKNIFRATNVDVSNERQI